MGLARAKAFFDLYQHGFAANDERDEDHKPINTPDAFAAEGQRQSSVRDAVLRLAARRIGKKHHPSGQQPFSQFELNGGSLGAPSKCSRRMSRPKSPLKSRQVA